MLTFVDYQSHGPALIELINRTLGRDTASTLYMPGSLPDGLELDDDMLAQYDATSMGSATADSLAGQPAEGARANRQNAERRTRLY